MRASPSLSQLWVWQPHSRLCHLYLCREHVKQQRSCSPSKELHATEGAVEVRRARRRLGDTVTDERVGLFTPDKDGGTHTSCGRAAVLAARRGTVCGEVGRVPRFCQLWSTHPPHPLYVCDVRWRKTKRFLLRGRWPAGARLWGEAGAPGGTVRRAAVRKRGSGSMSLYEHRLPD